MPHTQAVSHIAIRSFVGRAIHSHLPCVARLRMEVFREWPYLYRGDLEYEAQYLKKFSLCEEAILVLVFDGSTIVGAATGIPLECEDPAIQRPFLERSLNLSDYFYLGESTLLKEYRGRGVGHYFFDVREAHAHRLERFKACCFCCVERAENDPRKPPDYISFDDFWRKRGYIKCPEMTTMLSWPEISAETESEKPMVFWMKSY